VTICVYVSGYFFLGKSLKILREWIEKDRRWKCRGGKRNFEKVIFFIAVTPEELWVKIWENKTGTRKSNHARGRWPALKKTRGCNKRQVAQNSQTAGLEKTLFSPAAPVTLAITPSGGVHIRVSVARTFLISPHFTSLQSGDRYRPDHASRFVSPCFPAKNRCQFFFG
jgi:hypothetical protein